MMNYLNLTSGLEFARDVSDCKLVRIQSSHFEANAMWSCISDLDYGFLIDAATVGVNLYDCGSRRGKETRAQWKGVPWILWAYARANGEYVTASSGRYNWTKEFDAFYAHGQPDISPRAKAKLRYVGKLTGENVIRIVCHSMRSTMDGKTIQLARMARLRTI